MIFANQLRNHQWFLPTTLKNPRDFCQLAGENCQWGRNGVFNRQHKNKKFLLWKFSVENTSFCDEKLFFRLQCVIQSKNIWKILTMERSDLSVKTLNFFFRPPAFDHKKIHFNFWRWNIVRPEVSIENTEFA